MAAQRPRSVPVKSAHETSKEKRQRLITERLVAEGSCVPHSLAEEFGVSLMTIHRDLDDLERRGLVRKFHGGVTALPSSIFESQLSYRMVSRVREKQAVARAALKYVEPGMSMVLDDSTTTFQMISGLAELTPLHVATSFLPALRQLADLAADHDLTVLGLGGMYDLPHDSFVGMQCIEQIEAMHADAVFMSTSAVSATSAFHREERMVALKRAMVAGATRKYLLVDQEKLGQVALHRIVPLDVFDLVITNAGANPEVLSAWSKAGIPYECAE